MLISQPLLHLGVHKHKREEKLAKLLKELGPTSSLSNSECSSSNATSGKQQPKTAPSVKDVIGSALPRIGPYKKLDNKKQVVALIDDVIFLHFFFSFFAFFQKKTQNLKFKFLKCVSLTLF